MTRIAKDATLKELQAFRWMADKAINTAFRALLESPEDPEALWTYRKHVTDYGVACGRIEALLKIDSYVHGEYETEEQS